MVESGSKFHQAPETIRESAIPRKDDYLSLLYSEGRDITQITSYLRRLSRESSSFTFNQYRETEESVEIHLEANPIPGPELAEEIEMMDIGPEYGYTFAINVCPDGDKPEDQTDWKTEIGGVVSPEAPRSTLEKLLGIRPRISDGVAFRGTDDRLELEELWKEARKSGLREVRFGRNLGKWK